MAIELGSNAPVVIEEPDIFIYICVKFMIIGSVESVSVDSIRVNVNIGIGFTSTLIDL